MSEAGGARVGRSLLVVAVLAILLGIAGPSEAAVGELQIIVSGALGVPYGPTSDAELTLAIGTNLPVSLVSGGASLWPATLGLATFAEWTDAHPSVGFGQLADLFVFRLGGGFTVMAAGVTGASGGGPIGVPGRFATTFSATSPAETISGTWTIASATSLGVANAGPNDAVVTFELDSNPANTVFGVVPLVAQHALTSIVNKTVPGVATIGITRNVPVFALAGNAIGPHVGTLASYSAFNLVAAPSEFVEISAIEIGGTFVVYGCAFPGPGTAIACLLGGEGSVAHLSGHVTKTAGEFVTITGVTAADQLLTLTGSLP